MKKAGRPIGRTVMRVVEYIERAGPSTRAEVLAALGGEQNMGCAVRRAWQMGFLAQPGGERTPYVCVPGWRNRLAIGDHPIQIHKKYTKPKPAKRASVSSVFDLGGIHA